MGLLGYMAVSAALNVMDFIADDLVTLKCFGVDTFCNNSISTSSEYEDEESESEEYESEEYDEESEDEGYDEYTETDDSTGRISLCNRLFNLELDEIIDSLAAKGRSIEDDFEEDDDEDDVEDDENEEEDESSDIPPLDLSGQGTQPARNDSKSSTARFVEKLNAIKPEGVLDYYAALGVKADDEDEEEEDESDGIPPLDLTDQGPQPENAEYNRLMEYLAGISKRLDALEKANEAE